MSELDNGVPDPPPPQLCALCHLPKRDFQTINGKEYCDGCAEQISRGETAFLPLVGTGEP